MRFNSSRLGESKQGKQPISQFQREMKLSFKTLIAGSDETPANPSLEGIAEMRKNHLPKWQKIPAFRSTKQKQERDSSNRALQTAQTIAREIQIEVLNNPEPTLSPKTTLRAQFEFKHSTKYSVLHRSSPLLSFSLFFPQFLKLT